MVASAIRVPTRRRRPLFRGSRIRPRMAELENHCVATNGNNRLIHGRRISWPGAYLD